MRHARQSRTKKGRHPGSRRNHFKQAPSGSLKKLKGPLWNEIKTLKGVSGVGISEGCLLIYAEDGAAFDRVTRKIGGLKFRGAPLRHEQMGRLEAQA